MKKAIVAKKIGMIQVFSETGAMVPVTVLEAGPCVVVQVKTTETDGYEAVQVGFGQVKPRRVNKPRQGHFDKAGVAPSRVLKEFHLEGAAGYEIGRELKADVFSPGDRVDVTGISKGKGFQGAIKRHGLRRGPSSHGSKYHRGVGAMSAAATPGKVKKGKKLPGQMGHVKRTAQNLEIIRADGEKNLLLVKGSLPGPRGAVVTVKESVKV